MPRYTPLDMARLAPADVIEPLDYELILTELQDWVLERWDELRASNPSLPPLEWLRRELEPGNIILQAFAYRELLLRALINKRTRSVLLGYAQKDTLDHLGALMNTARRPIVAEPRDKARFPQDWQSDAEFRQEIQLAPESFSVAGPQGAYEYFARRAHPSLKGAAAVHRGGPRVDVAVLSRDGNGTPTAEAISAAAVALSWKTTRPMTDDARVRAPTIVTVPVTMRLQLRNGPDPAAVRARAEAGVLAYRNEIHEIGRILRADALIAAGRSGGDIEKLILLTPTADVDPGPLGVCWLEPIAVTAEVLP